MIGRDRPRSTTLYDDRLFTRLEGSTTVETMTPVEYAKSRNIDATLVRRLLRKEFPRSPVDHGSRWVMTPAMVIRADRHFIDDGPNG